MVVREESFLAPLARAELGYAPVDTGCVSLVQSLILSCVHQHPRYPGCLLPCPGHHSTVLPTAPGPCAPASSFAEVSLGKQFFLFPGWEQDA